MSVRINTMVFYRDWLDTACEMDYDNYSAFIHAVLRYAFYGLYEFADGEEVARGAFNAVKPIIDRDIRKYKERGGLYGK